MVTLFIEREQRREEVEFSGRIATLLAEHQINPETVVVVKNGEVVAENERCGADDEIKCLSVISGG